MVGDPVASASYVVNDDAVSAEVNVADASEPACVEKDKAWSVPDKLFKAQKGIKETLVKVSYVLRKVLIKGIAARRASTLEFWSTISLDWDAPTSRDLMTAAEGDRECDR